MQFWKGANGQQSGDPAKLAKALIAITAEEKPPLRFLAGADVVATAEQIAATLTHQTHTYHQLYYNLVNCLHAETSSGALPHIFTMRYFLF